MKTYNVDSVEYKFWLLPPDGKKKDITDLVESAVFTDTEDNIVSTVDLRVKNEKVDGFWVHAFMHVAHRFLIEARDDDHKWTEVYRGSFTHWQTNASDFTVESEAADGNQAVISNDIIHYFPDGPIVDRIKKIIGQFDVTLGKIEGIGGTLAKELVKTQATSAISDYKEKSEEKTGVKTVIRSTKGAFEIVKRGTNNMIYVLDYWAAKDGKDVRKIPSDFATIVKVYGSSKDDKMPPLKSTASGNTKFGKHTEIIYSSDYKTAAEANKAAQNILKNQGKLKKEQTIKDHVDIPWIRVGDVVDVAIGTIGGLKNGLQVPARRYVTALSRDYVAKTMTLELEE